ncbi:MAG TPA: DUF1588 domain-containing protein [Polyangiaceae bacterium]|nr:DUF1588 domain-containing protein [Polyangiaceae bacterium]
MNSARLACVAGTLGFLVGCSGTYKVGDAPTDNGGSPGVSGGPGADVAGAATASAGDSPVSSSGGAAVGDIGVSTGDAGAGDVGGAVGVAGAAPIVYCGVTLAPPAPAVAFATTEAVWDRIQSFLGTSQPIPINLPVASTRDLAGALADKTLDSLNGAPAPGLAGFVSAWWPGTPNAGAWAGLFGDPKATLTDLLTTTSVANPGSGVLTDPTVLKKTEITTRGIFIDEHLLCLQVPLAPVDIPALPPAQPGQTRRQQLEQDVMAPACATCHRLMDPIGDSLEHYDTVGNFNTLDNGSPIDSAGTLPARSAIMSDITFADVNELGTKLAKDCGASQCLTQQLLADAETSAKLPVPGSTDPQVVAEIAFASSSGKLRDLIRNIVESDTFLRAK